MFTGIIEYTAEVTKILVENGNIHFSFRSPFINEFYIDQSIAHNGVCLTVVSIVDNEYTVTAIEETLNKTNLKHWKIGSRINIERCLTNNKRLDGHFVQGHVDTTTQCTKISEADGSWYYEFTLPSEFAELVVDKGSICINGVSLTVILNSENTFQVAIIPYTYEHTNFGKLNVGDTVNLEFDILGKYVSRILKLRGQ
ncbi:MAG: riboflavin synthase [Lewinellaceae bacterium]|nr:riboflavin synthase [Lewinellaceae bacterium]